MPAADAVPSADDRDSMLEGKVAIVTGGSSAIGRAIALRFANAGARAVIVADLQQSPREGGVPTHELIAEAGGRACFVRSDVASPDGIHAALEAADAFGGVDVLVNNAGVLRAGNFLKFTGEAYDAMMAVNVKGTFFASQAAARSMVEGGRTGAIVNLSSVGALHGMPGIAAYSAAKGAVRALTYSLATELGPRGIRVVALHPGVIDTSMTRVDISVVGHEGEAEARDVPLGRLGVPKDVAEAACFVASDRAGFITGASLVVDGGQLSIG